MKNYILYFFYTLKYGGVKARYKRILKAYLEISVNDTANDLEKRELGLGICCKIGGYPIALRKGMRDVLRDHIGYIGNFYCPTVLFEMDNFDSPIGEDLYYKCIAPRVLLLERIIEGL